MSALDTTRRLLGELSHIDEREDKILAALLKHGAQLEERELREKSVAVADLQELKLALDETLAKIAKAQAAAAAPVTAAEAPATNGGATAPAAPLAVASVGALADRIARNDAENDSLREQLAQRLQALAPFAERAAAEVASAPPDRAVKQPRTFVLQRGSLMKGADVRAFQRVLNARFAGLRIGRRIAENGVYGPKTREAAHQVAYCLGLLKSDLEQGITPRVRVALRDVDRRTDAQKRRAREQPCREYRAKLRRRYAKAPVGRPGTGTGANIVGATGGLAAAIRAHGGRYEDLIIREAKRSRLPVALLCAVVEKESNFTNVFGHDPTIFVGAGAVTKEKYLSYKKLRGPRGKGGMQGVGPCQLTWYTIQDRADDLGGCWMPGANIRAGAEELKRLIGAHGLSDGVRRYNGDGANARAYARDVLKKKAVWEARLKGHSSAAPMRPSTVPAPGAGKPARRPGKGKLTARGRTLHWLTKHRGITEQPLGSNTDNRADGIRAAQKRIGTPVGGAWCGTWCASAALAGGVRMTRPHRWARVADIEDDAKAGTNGFRGWTRDQRHVLRGDLVVLYGRGKHVEVVRKVSRMRKIVITDGGNTSSGERGSQTNGHGAYMRKRPFSAVHGYALVDYPDR